MSNTRLLTYFCPCFLLLFQWITVASSAFVPVGITRPISVDDRITRFAYRDEEERDDINKYESDRELRRGGRGQRVKIDDRRRDDDQDFQRKYDSNNGEYDEYDEYDDSDEYDDNDEYDEYDVVKETKKLDNNENESEDDFTFDGIIPNAELDDLDPEGNIDRLLEKLKEPSFVISAFLLLNFYFLFGFWPDFQPDLSLI